jgi:hypothetical protein
MRCTHYDERTRCPEEATHLLYHPDGTPNPGGWMCRAHAQLVISEYRVQLGESWTAEPIEAEERT